MDKQASLNEERRRLLELRLKGSPRAAVESRQIPKRPPGSRAPLSAGQHQMWVVDQMNPGQSAYNVPFAYRIHGELDVPALQESINQVIRRHESWRTTFREAEGRPVQEVHPEYRLQIAITDLGHLPDGERERQFAALAAEVGARPFDLRRLPLIRVSLFRFGGHEHVLLFNLHHIICDFWSCGIFAHELTALYAAIQSGQPSPLPDLALQYGDYAHWQRAHTTDAALASHLAFWRERLDGNRPPLPIPADRSRPAWQTQHGGVVTRHLPGKLASRLRDLAREEGATLFILTLAAFKALLARYTGESDICVGSPIAQRPNTDTEKLIGYFMNILALRSDLSGDPSFRELLRRVRATVFDAFQHQDVPFDKIVEELHPSRGTSHQPIFQIAFILMPSDKTLPAFAGAEVESLTAPVTTSKFDLTLILEETGGGLSTTMEYSTDQFEAATARRMLESLEFLLGGIVADPTTPLSLLPILTPPARQCILTEWNRTEAELPEETVPAAFERQAARTPDAIAVESGDRSLTYRELAQRASLIAQHLSALGAKPGLLIGVCVERSVEMVAAVLGILQAGATYVPLDPAFPSARLAMMIEDAAMQLIVTQSALAATLPPHHATLLCLDDPALRIPPVSGPPLRAATLDDLAYVIFTSGSTGRPKGVEISQRALVNFLSSMRRAPGISSEDVLLAVTTLSFDIAGLEIFLPLLNGARLVVLSRETAMDGWALRDALEHHRVTLLQATPATWRLLLESGWNGTPNLKALIGGEACPRELAAQLLPRLGELWNMYGPTETTIWSTIQRLLPDDGPITIGRPIANTKVYLLDDHLQPTPVGVPGELHIGGLGLARGYLNRPELTAEKFPPDPFSTEPNARMYKTGDLARYLPDGRIECLGRIDRQIKLRGFRIEPGEIEAVFRTHPEVRDAAVTVRRSAAGEERLLGYYIPRDGRPVDEPTMRHHLEQHLPLYMVPSVLLHLQSLPLTPNRKVDYKALPDVAPAVSRPRDTAPAETPLQVELVALWEELLDRRAVGIHDDFFELGGHSLLALRMIARIARSRGVHLPLRALFEAPTIAHIAVAIETTPPEAADASPISRTARTDDSPLSYSQHQMWLIEQLAPGNAAYHIAFAYRLRGLLDLRALEESFNRIIARHEAWRTTFVAVDDEAVQRVHPDCRIRIAVIDLTAMPADQAERQAHEMAAQEMLRPFDLRRLPLVRVSLFKLRQDEHVLLINLHHIVGDGGSSKVLFDELGAFYHAAVSGIPARVPDLPVQYADYAIWQQENLSQGRYAPQLNYWKQQLGGNLPVLDLPTDLPRPAGQSFKGATVELLIPRPLVQALVALATRENCTLFTVSLAAFAVILNRYSRGDDILIGTPVSSRTTAEVSGLIGNFVNIVALRGDLSGNPTVLELLRRCQQTTLDALTNKDVPFEMVVKELKLRRDPSRNPVFQALLEVMHTGSPQLGDLAVSRYDVEVLSAQVDLTLYLSEQPGGEYFGLFNYCADLFARPTIERFAANFVALLEEMVRDPLQRVAEIPILSGTRRNQVLAEWNRTEAELPEETVPAAFERQAARTPDAIAVESGDRSLTYRELAQRASLIAQHLSALGAKPGLLIGVCVERSVEMVAAVLGILQAGAAYVPLDPAFPSARLAMMIEDAAMQLIVTQSALAATLPPHHATLLCLDDPALRIPPVSGPPLRAATLDDLAYVIFTSGSTGRPKGVEISQRALVNFLSSMRRAPGISSEDVLLAVTTLSFDIAGLEIFLPLLNGARLVVLSRETAMDGWTLRAEIERHRATLLQATPSIWRLLLESGWNGTPNLKALIGGEACPRELAAQLLPRLGELWNMYGPTETTIWSTIQRLLPDDGPITIGRPIANTKVYLLDDHLQPTPVGVPGELHIGGLGLARGYLNRPELTAEKFPPDPFSTEPNARMYKTGDLARYLPDGRIECLGRIDRQIKLRGFRIEPGEIEAVFRTHPEVRDAAVTVRPSPSGDEQLLGYYIPRDGRSVDEAGVRRHLEQHLPIYMVPNVLMPLEALPLTPNKKVDYKALPEVAPAALRAREITPPETPLQKELVALWEELLDRRPIGIRESFFELGGHSLMAFRMIARIARIWGVNLPLRGLFEAPTITDVAAAIQAAPKDNGAPTEAAPIPVARRLRREQPK